MPLLIGASFTFLKSFRSSLLIEFSVVNCPI